ncbi:MAG: M28 family peptidase [Bacteroidia bacterium]|nr:M28 family peptidase [Bacteroidia bacterium]
MKKTLSLVLAGFLLSLIPARPMIAQGPPDEAADRNNPAMMAKFAGTISPEDLKAHLTFLASDELEGRETATRGQRVAAKYIAAQFGRLGLKPPVIENGQYSYLQTFLLESASVKSARISLSPKSEYSLMKDFFAFNRGAFAQDLKGDLVFAGYGIGEEKYNNIGNTLLSGKIAVVLSGEPVGADGNYLLTGTTEPSEWSTELRKKRNYLQEKGAIAMLTILKKEDFDRYINSRWVKRLVEGSSLGLAADKTDPPIPMIYLSEEMGLELFKKNKMKLDDVRKSLNQYALVPEQGFKGASFSMTVESEVKEVESHNVLGLLEGTGDSKDIILVTAHYDHLGISGDDIYNGADDDGSGTVTVLELAEAFTLAAQNGYRPNRSILFMCVSGEEKGLLGSEYYTEHPVFPLENTICDLNIDMIGRVDKQHESNENYVYVIGSDRLSSELHEINESANKDFTRLTLDYTYNSEDDPNRFYYRSDHYNFAKHNIPVIFYFTGVHDDYHKPTDTVEKIRFGKMTTIGELVFMVAWKVANHDHRIVVDKTPAEE